MIWPKLDAVAVLGVVTLMCWLVALANLIVH